MKRCYSLLLMLFLYGAAAAQTAAVPAPVAALKETEFDFGKVPQGKPVYHYFEIVNKTAQPLKIDNVQASCGCTTPEWSTDPVAPGAMAKIKVGFNAAAEGPFEKFITVQYNGGVTEQIKIKGLVWRVPAGAAPANASVQFLKQKMQ